MSNDRGKGWKLRRWSWRRSTVRAVVVAVGLLGSVLVAPGVARADDLVAPGERDALLFGAHPSPAGDETRVDAANALQDDLGHQLEVIRRYLWWEDDPGSDPLVAWTLDQGSRPHISLRPQRADQTRIPWSDIATAPEGSQLDLDMKRWAASIAALDAPVWFTFHHEPETVGNMPFGVDVEFIAAWRRIVDTFAAEGVTNADYVWVMTGYAFSRPETDRRFADAWYPGDDWVDHIGADPYNWFECRPHVSNPWRTFEEIATPVRDYAAQHPQKGLIIAEFGSAEDPDDPTRKAEWVTEIRRLLRTPEWSQTVGIMSFHADHQQDGSTCDWWVDSSPDSLAAYRALINDPIFGGDGDAPGPPPPGPDPLGCRAHLVGGSVTVEWDDFAGTEVLRRNGVYLASPAPGATSHADQSPVVGDNEYTIRVWGHGTFVDHPCGTVIVGDDAPGPLVCTITTDGSQVEVIWSDTPDREILRRNGAWRASPEAAATSFHDTVPMGTHVYELRVWGGGSFTDTPCGTATVEPGAAPQCDVTVLGNDAMISWQGFSGVVVIRRDHQWRATPPATAVEFTDAALPAGTYDYTVRVWAGGSFTDTDCGTAAIG